MDCKDFICILIMYLLVELVKARFTREHFTRRNNNLNMMLQDGDGNIQIMKVHHIYDAIEKAKQDAIREAVKQAEQKTYAALSQNVTTKKITVSESLDIKGGTHQHGWQSHFPYSDGKNYIRGPTQIDGDLTVNGNILWNGKSPIVRGDQVSLRFGNNNYVKAGWGNVVQDGNKHPIEIQKY